MHHCSLLLVSNAFISPAVKSEAFIIVSMGTPSDSRLEAIDSLAFLSPSARPSARPSAYFFFSAVFMALTMSR